MDGLVLVWNSVLLLWFCRNRNGHPTTIHNDDSFVTNAPLGRYDIMEVWLDRWMGMYVWMGMDVWTDGWMLGRMDVTLDRRFEFRCFDSFFDARKLRRDESPQSQKTRRGVEYGPSPQEGPACVSNCVHATNATADDDP
jgi:hypothetical protein